MFESNMMDNLAVINSKNIEAMRKLSFHSYINQFSGETVYQICDNIGLLFSSIYKLKAIAEYEKLTSS